jgi:hypothetical protein
MAYRINVFSSFRIGLSTNIVPEAFPEVAGHRQEQDQGCDQEQFIFHSFGLVIQR